LNEPQNGPQKMLETIKQNPHITKTALSGILGVSASTLKRWLRSNDVVWVGSSKNGHWEITPSE
ncbi:MAG: winged helix-turn-helix transcriptional regulator, partial [Muribaculaceae bacterium]|nr:winged helix-turn-helix transcriptional regulator [Muribaculaceae bacterium]